jgi:hypothetical protein
MAILAIFTLIWSINMSRKLITLGQEISPFKKQPRPIVEAVELDKNDNLYNEENIFVKPENNSTNTTPDTDFI